MTLSWYVDRSRLLYASPPDWRRLQPRRLQTSVNDRVASDAIVTIIVCHFDQVSFHVSSAGGSVVVLGLAR
jgi:hypothetical protein